jgi:HK97 family phage portal protein
MAGLLSSLALKGAPAEARELVDPKRPRDPAIAALFADPSSMAVTPDSAMKVTAVYASVSLIAETPAALPLHVYRTTQSGDVEGATESAKATDHPLYAVLHDMPSPGLTSFEWRELMFTHTALRGDSYARIVQNGAGEIVELPPILPDHIRPERNRLGRVQYRWWPDGSGPSRILFDDEVLRLPYKMLDGLHSLSVIATHRLTIGNALQASSMLSSFYKNSAQPKGALVSQEPLNDEAAKAMRESWERRHQGPENAHRVAIFDGGLKWEQIGMTMDDAQYIQLQEFSVADIARIFLVPPHKIGDLSNATFSNIEHQAIAFVTDTLLRWVRRAEMRYNAYLLSKAERKAGYFIAFDLKGLLRGDAASRAAFYRALFYIGAMNPNEIRAAEDMNPYNGGGNFYVQGATLPIDALLSTPAGQQMRELVDAAIAEAVARIEQERRVTE